MCAIGHMVWETCACVDNTKGMVKDRRRAAVGGVCGFVVCCAVSDTTPLLLVGVVVLGVLVVIVAGSRPVVLFEPGC